MVILYLDSSRGISASLVLGALLDAGADIALVQRILGTVTLPRIVLMRASERAEMVCGTAASAAIGPIPRGIMLIDAIRALENGRVPLAVRTWGGGMLARLLEAEAMLRGEPLDAVPLADPLTVAELLAVSAALAALHVVRVYAAPVTQSNEQRTDAFQGSSNKIKDSEPRIASRNQTVRMVEERPFPALSMLLLEEAEWPVGPDAVVTPGGAAILATLAEPDVPPVCLAAVGYGIAPDAPRLLRCWLGTPYNTGKMTISPGARTGATAHTHPHTDGDDH